MIRQILRATLLLLTCLAASAESPAPLRIFIRAGEKTHGPGQHDHPRFLADWKNLLNERGAKADGALNFPTAEQLDASDVLVMYAAEAGTILPEQRINLENFLKRGGGMVVIHDAVCGKDPQWFKTIIGGAWEHGHSKWFEGNVSIYFQDHSHPITKGVSNFDLDDEMYYDLHLMPEANILAATYAPDKRNMRDGKMFPSVYDIVPQMWTYEKTLSGGKPYRAFVSIPGHKTTSFNLPQYRALLLRGIAWAGKHDVDSLATKEELASLRYPEGGPTAPEKAAAKIVVHPDFKINLVAAEPLIEKPISLDWDAQGRMWIAETPEYPNGRKIDASKDDIKAHRPARDRISILQDSNGDGVMDKKTVFFEGLELVTSLVFYKDGVIVSQAPDIYWLRDTNGDGKADEKITLFTGFGTRDAHAVVSNMRWGMDGWIYATVGYSKGDIFSGDGKKHFGPISDGVIRFKPNGSAIEQFCSKGSNTWGVDIAPDGEVFFSQANGNHIDHVVMPESALARGKIEGTTSFKVIEDHKSSMPIGDYSKQAYAQIDWVGGFTAASGACIYNGGAWPEKFNNTFFVTEPTVNLVHQDFLKPDGVTYIASRDPERPDKEFIASTDLWFRPIHTRVGPDGALYILDFYNQAAVHNDTRGPKHGANNAAVRPDRDHYFGRVWRVQHKDAKKFEVPNLAKASRQELIKALEHPNGWVRDAAARLLSESENQPQWARPLVKSLAEGNVSPDYLSVSELWAWHRIVTGFGKNMMSDYISVFLGKDLLTALTNASPTVRKTALQIIFEDAPHGRIHNGNYFTTNVIQTLQDSDARVRLYALLALGSIQQAATAHEQVWQKDQADLAVQSVVSLFPDLKNPWLESAAVGFAAQLPLDFVKAAAASKNPDGLKPLVGELSTQIGNKQDATLAAQLVTSVAAQKNSAHRLKQIALENLAKTLKPETTPKWSADLENAFHTLLSSENAAVTAATLPLISRWDKNGAMTAEVNSFLPKLFSSLTDASQPDDQREQAMKSLLSLRASNSEILPAIAKILGSHSSVSLQQRVIESLGALNENGSGKILVEAYPRVPSELQENIFAQIIRRADWSLAMANAIDGGKINLGSLSPNSVHRLRTHGDPKVAQRANEVFEKLRGPEVKEKNALIEKFTPVVTQPGNAKNGHKLFTANCAVCHKFQGEGKEVAPDLTGMGVHGAAELLVHVLDPNRVVEPNFIAYSIETADDQSLDGILASENKKSVVLRNATGDFEIERKNIKSQRSTGRSLMPEGFEALGGEGLRDLLSYICAGENRFRVIDLKKAFTASSTRGLYNSTEAMEETIAFKRFGLVKIGDVPFEIVSPAANPNGNNVISLKGGFGFAKTLPQKVEIADVNLKTKTLHFLGGVAGWGYPCCGDNDHKGTPAAKLTAYFTDGASEEIVMTNGVEFADYNRPVEVPGSQEAPGLVSRGQMRWFTKKLEHSGTVKKMTIESFDNYVSPLFAALTAEVDDGAKIESAHSEATPAPLKFEWTKNPRVLIVGGGSSHDFTRWFNEEDSKTLSGNASVNYTEDVSRMGPALKEIDVLYLCSNQPMTNREVRKAIFDFADAGKSLLLVHPSLWYNWKNWPEYNRVLVGGGARGHEKLGEFEVTVEMPEHPIMRGVPKTFRISDELYRHEQETNGTPIEILATGKSLVTGKIYPVVWITKHPKAKIVCITLGHDGAAHELPAYKTILQNSVKWATVAPQK
ncbi:MAG: PVC-type heme-binding CxxCH protein [Verrucomicrobiota bacterium]